MKYLSLTLFTLFSVIQYGNAQAVFQESGGIVTIEMESTFGQPLGNWVPGTAVDPEQGPPSDPLEYVFKINKSGVYSLHLHCAKLNQEFNGRMRNDVANDAYV